MAELIYNLPFPQLLQRLDASKHDWLDAIDNIPDTLLNVQPPEGRWSPAQVAMHMVLTERGIVKILNGPSESLQPGRGAAFERIHHNLTDRTRKIKAPEFIDPRDETYVKQALLEKFKTQRDLLLQTLSTATNLENLFLFSHAHLGTLTGFEWAYMALVHANRHLLQLREMTEVTKAKNAAS